MGVRALRAAAAALLALLAAPSAFAAPEKAERAPAVPERTFTLQYRRADDAAFLVRPLLSAAGSVTLRSNHLTVRDAAPVLERCAQAIAAFDLPPRSVALSVTLLRASGTAAGPSGAVTVSDEIRGVGERLRKLFNFTAYAPLDALVVQGTEGDSVSYTIGGDYRLAFLLEPSSDARVVRLKDLTLERLRKDAQGKETRSEILHTSVNVPMGQTNVLGIGRDEAATGALFLVFSASSRLPGPGIAGVR